MNFRCLDNSSDFLEPGSGGKAVAKWGIHTKPTPRGCDIMKAGTAADPGGGATRGGKKPQEKSPDQA